MKKKPNIWRILGLIGMVGSGICMVLQGLAEDRDLDKRVDEAVDKKLAESQKAEEQ